MADMVGYYEPVIVEAMIEKRRIDSAAAGRWNLKL
jgi:hypothetical protein